MIRGREVVNIRVPVDDSGVDDISIYFDKVSDKIKENYGKGGQTLVDCMAGASRSTSIVLSYLVKEVRPNSMAFNCELHPNNFMIT